MQSGRTSQTDDWLRKTRSAIPSLCARKTRELNAIVFSAGTFSNRNEVKDTSLYVVERIDIVVGLMQKETWDSPVMNEKICDMSGTD